MPHPSTTLETPLLRFLKDTHADFSRIDEGEVASYIPELGKANPDHFGIAVATTDGHVYEAGDTQVPFTIQSVSKAMVFALALDLLGAERVEAAIGVEPSGEAFNSIRLRADNKPFNAMVNAGAIACSGLIAESTGGDAFELIRQALGRFAGRDLGLDEAVFESERSTGDRNRAIAYLLRTYGGVTGDVDRLLDVYFRQCSVLVTARDLAVMGATFANHGVNPLTGVTVASSYAVARTLAVMSSSGMYDFAGEWIYRVGVPAKSGVGGGILAALPSQLGLGTFSPRLDMHGNSVRGIRTCEAISEAFDLHMLSRRDDVRTCIVADYDFRTVPSKPGRQPHEQDILSARSGAIRAIELAGKLSFASMDYVTRRLTDPGDVPEFLILNLHRVATITDAGLRLLTGLIKNQLPAATTAVIAGVEAASPLNPQLKALREQGVRVRIFPTYDAAVEWAEDQVVYRHGGFSRIEVEADLSRQALLAGLSPQELADLSRLGTRVVFPAGTRIISANEPPARVYFLLRGMVSARSVGDVRLSTMIPGMVFGEMALIEQPRSTDVWADTEAVCVEVTADQFHAFQETHARAADKIMRNLAILLAGRIRMATARIEMLTG
ncbi:MULTISPECIES: glutaminase A [unclassified Xanthobacter]|uniref:glutaminase A n=1 Tax=unclassified Xanthobacter TaxID=2623496 RepID=UPI0004981E6A|nr:MULTISPECIES: glutaminase A [unclassified Xanthobacter]